VDNIIDPALLQLPADQLDQPASREGFFEQLKKLLGAIAQRLWEQPLIVAHTENTFDGSGVRRLLANKFELDKVQRIPFFSALFLYIPTFVFTFTRCNFLG
jgi:hypothetical protein